MSGTTSAEQHWPHIWSSHSRPCGRQLVFVCGPSLLAICFDFLFLKLSARKGCACTFFLSQNASVWVLSQKCASVCASQFTPRALLIIDKQSCLFVYLKQIDNNNTRSYMHTHTHTSTHVAHAFIFLPPLS